MVDTGELTVIVRDRGSGILPRVDGGGLGLGLPLIAALTQRAEIGGHAGGGTEVAMTFDDGHVERRLPGRGPARRRRRWPAPCSAASSASSRASVALPIDRLSDALLVSDAVTAATRGGAHTIQVEAGSEPRRLELRVGPLEPGGATRLIGSIEAPLGAGALSRLVDELATADDDGSEFLVLGARTCPVGRRAPFRRSPGRGRYAGYRCERSS